MRKVLIALLLVLIPVFATALPQQKLVYKAAQGQGVNEKIIKKGIEGAIEGMSFITRPIARGKLTKSNIAFKTITVEQKGSKISITHDARKPVVSPADGTKVKWTREDGEVFGVTQKVSDQEIVQVFHADEGVKTLKYVFNDDFSKMDVAITLDSPKLSGPLKYKLAYTK